MLTNSPRPGVGKQTNLHTGTSQRLATPLPIMTTPITNTTRTMIVTLFCNSHSRSVSNGPRVCDGATKLAITGTATVDVAIAVNPTMTTDAWPMLSPASATMTPAERAINRFFGTTADNSRPSTSALPGAIESTPAIHFDNSARSPLAARPRHCLSAKTTRSTPTTILITAAARDDPLESCIANRPGSNAKSATAPPTPTTQPTSRATVLLFACGDSNIRTIVMIVVTLIAIATARGSSSPIAVPMRIRLTSDDRGRQPADRDGRLEAALTATRRDDLEHGTNAAYVRGCVCSDCRTHQRNRMARNRNPASN